MRPRSIIFILIAACALGALVSIAWKFFSSIEDTVQYSVAYGLAREVQSGLASGDADAVVDSFRLSDSADREAVIGSVRVLAGLHPLHNAMLARYGEGLDEPPFPQFDSSAIESIERGEGFLIVGSAEAGLVLLNDDDGLRVDPRPFIDPDIDPDQAEAMRLELLRLTQRVEAGEFATRGDALAAYNAAVFLGALRSIDPPTTRATEALP